jgi:hypothetical protein
MSYPGDQQQPGGWGSSRPPQSPYGPADDQAAHGGSPYGPGHDSPGGGSYGGPGYGSYGSEQPDPYAGPSDSPYGGPSSEPPSPPYGDSFEPRYGSYDMGDDGGGDGSGRKGLIVGAAIIVGVVVVGGGAALALTSGGKKDSPSAGATNAAPSASKPSVNPTPSPTETGRGERLQSRATDPKPLTLNEVFKAKSFKAGGKKYQLTARRAEKKCAPPTHGATFRKAIAKAGCNQVLRATFGNGKLIGTIGVLNLKSETDANNAQVASRVKDAFILPLPGSGTTKNIGQGLSLTTAEVDGHYLIMSWVQYPTGKKIAKSDYAAVTTFVRSTTFGSNLRTALNYRSMVGKPS